MLARGAPAQAQLSVAAVAGVADPGHMQATKQVAFYGLFVTTRDEGVATSIWALTFWTPPNFGFQKAALKRFLNQRCVPATASQIALLQLAVVRSINARVAADRPGVGSTAR